MLASCPTVSTSTFSSRKTPSSNESRSPECTLSVIVSSIWSRSTPAFSCKEIHGLPYSSCLANRGPPRETTNLWPLRMLAAQHRVPSADQAAAEEHGTSHPRSEMKQFDVADRRVHADRGRPACDSADQERLPQRSGRSSPP